MNRANNFVRRYALSIAAVGVLAVLTFVKPEMGVKASRIAADNFLTMLSVVVPIFTLLGLLDVWVSRETMVRYMGEGSGLRGVLLAFFIGSAAAGPLYAAFPVAGLMLKKDCKFSNALIMLGAWSTTKIPLLLFESSAMGLRFTATRFILNLAGIAAIAALTEKSLSDEEQQQIRQRARAGD
jgi:uncharacterized membrane protein YraQ (UPF0718 family)